MRRSRKIRTQVEVESRRDRAALGPEITPSTLAIGNPSRCMLVALRASCCFCIRMSSETVSTCSHQCRGDIIYEYLGAGLRPAVTRWRSVALHASVPAGHLSRKGHPCTRRAPPPDSPCGVLGGLRSTNSANASHAQLAGHRPLVLRLPIGACSDQDFPGPSTGRALAKLVKGEHAALSVSFVYLCVSLSLTQRQQAGGSACSAQRPGCSQAAEHSRPQAPVLGTRTLSARVRPECSPRGEVAGRSEPASSPAEACSTHAAPARRPQHLSQRRLGLL